jgi:hypothetical protein
MIASTRFRRLSGFAVAAAIAGACVAVSVASPASAALGAGGEFFPLTPERIYDSRPESAVNEPSPGPRPASPAVPTFDIQLLGQGGLPANAAEVLSVVVNITVVQPTGEGWLDAHASGKSPGTSSLINYTPGRTVPNLAVVVPGANGKLTLRLFATASASAHVVVDVFGWFGTSASPSFGSRLNVIPPGRLLDTDGAGGNFVGQEARPVQVRGATLANGQVVPAAATAVMLNVASDNAYGASVETFVTVQPDQPVGLPRTSNLNVYGGQIKANAVIVPIGADGRIWLYNHLGSNRLVVDVVGYFAAGDPATTKGRVVPLATPFRLWDTREAAFGAARLGAGQAEDWGFGAFVNSVQIEGQTGVPQGAVIGNLTVAELQRQYSTVPVGYSYMSAWPPDAGGRPEASVINIPPGAIPTPNMAVLTYSALKTVRFYNFQGQVHYLFDASAVVLD